MRWKRCSGGKLQEGDHYSSDQQLGEDDLDDRLVDDGLDVRLSCDLGVGPADGSDDCLSELRVRTGGLKFTDRGMRVDRDCNHRMLADRSPSA